jgi:hypothetical protein
MPGPVLPLYSLSQGVAVAFINGLFYGLYLVTTCFANRWLFFADEGWKFRKQIHWLMAIVTNLVWALSVVGLGLSIHTPISKAAFVEAGHRTEDFAGPGWDDIGKVGFYIHKLESGGELTRLVLRSLVRGT